MTAHTKEDVKKARKARIARIDNILRSARFLLADPTIKDSDGNDTRDGSRWTFDHLLSYLSEGQQEIAKETKHIRRTAQYQLNSGQSVYQLPEDLITIKAIWYRGLALPVISVQDLGQVTYYTESFQPAVRLDTFGFLGNLSTEHNWRNETTAGPIDAIILDNHNVDSFRVYPIPIEVPEAPVGPGGHGNRNITRNDLPPMSMPPPSEDQAMDPEPMIEKEPIAGIPITETGQVGIDKPYLQDVNFEASDSDGITSEPEPQQAPETGLRNLTIDYTHFPDPVTKPTDKLLIKRAYDIALKYYIAHQAFLADTDRASIEKSELHLRNFHMQVRKAKQEASSNNLDDNLYTTGYNPLG